jgi:hypothetical protein
MNHKIVSSVVGLLAILSVGVGAIFAFTIKAANQPEEPAVEVAAAPFIPVIAHPVDETMTDCARCHNAAEDDWPPSHITYEANTCQTCHQVEESPGIIEPTVPTETPLSPATPVAQEPTAAAEIPVAQEPADNSAAKPVPHPVTGKYTECIKCHTIGGKRSMPENHAAYTNVECQDCHTVPLSAEGVEENTGGGRGPAIPHEVKGIFATCDTCHAIGNAKLAMPENHASYSNKTCQKCHQAGE